jgi:hypothetical protein
MHKNDKPYRQEVSTSGVIKRTFDTNIDPSELVWHRDRRDRVVTPTNENDWMIQFDNELPKKLVIGESITIPKESYHRVIKGSGDLIVEIEEFDSLEEAKKKKPKRDACYHKVKSRYSVWPSAYGSGSLVQCRKVGAKNWGNKSEGVDMNEIEESKDTFQNIALDKIKSLGGFDKLPDIDKLALLGGTNDSRLQSLNLIKIYKENGGTFGNLNIKVKIKDSSQQPIKHEFSREFAGKEGYLTRFIHVNSSTNKPYVTVRFDEFIDHPDSFGGGSYEHRPIYLANMYPIDYDEVKSEFANYQNKIDFEKGEFNSGNPLSEKTDYSKEKEKGLHGWFERKGGEGSQGWVDCNTCRTDKETGRKKCKPCGRKEGETRSKYPACRPTPSACKTKDKGEKWGKKSENTISLIRNLIHTYTNPKN